MLFCGFNKTTLLDYPEHVAATIFLGGCNFRCPFCQNSDLLLHPAEFATFTEEEILSYLDKRKHILSGVCVSGGEPTIYKELPAFLKKLKALGYLVKLDTNGTNPSMLMQLYKDHLIDYVAMDIKSGFSDYLRVAGISAQSIFFTSKEQILANLEKSIHFLMKEADPTLLSYEFRTTVVRELHSHASFEEIGHMIKGARHYYLQSYQDSDGILCPGYSAYSKSELQAFADQLRAQIPSVMLRGVD